MAALELFNTTLFSDANLVSYYRLENLNDSKGSNTLTASGSPSNVAAQFGNGYAFVNASSQYLTNTAPTGLNISGSQTFMVYIKPSDLDGHQNYITGFSDSGATNQKGFYYAGSLIRFRLDGLTTNQEVTGGALSNGTAYLIFGVYDSSNSFLKIWVNGTKTQVTASGSATTVDDDFSIGRLGAFAGNYTDATWIDDVAFFNRALSDAEVTAHYNGTDGSNPQVNVFDSLTATENITAVAAWSAKQEITHDPSWYRGVQIRG